MGRDEDSPDGVEWMNSGEPAEVLDTGPPVRRRRWMPLLVVVAAGAVIAALVGVGRSHPGAAPSSATSSSPPASPSTSSVALTRLVGDCSATRAPAGSRPPTVLRYSPPPPVPWIKDWYGNGSLWVMLPPDGRLPTQAHADGSVSTKFPFYRISPGQVQVHAQRLDGPPGRFSAAVGTVDEYGNSGFVPSELTFSTPGCWRLRAAISGEAVLMFTVLVNRPVVSRRLLARPLRLPKLRPGQVCPVSGGSAFAAGGAIGFGGTAQGIGPVRPLVGDQSGLAHLINHTTHRGWLAAKTLWFSAPSYRGPYLVRVRRLDGTGPVGVLDNPHRDWFLVPLGPTSNEADGYRETPGATWMKRPGCVGWQIDGLNFSHVIIVRFTE